MPTTNNTEIVKKVIGGIQSALGVQPNPIFSYLASIDYDKRRLLSVREASEEPTQPSASHVRQTRENSVILRTTKQRNIDRNISKFPILKPTEDVIYPGALIFANQKLAEGKPQPVSLKRAPVTIRVDLPGLDANGVKRIDHPKNMTVQTAVDEVLKEWNKTPQAEGYVNAYRSIGRIHKAHSTKQLALSLGFRADWAGENVAAALQVNHNAEEEMTVAFFRQVFYSVKVDSPEHPEDVFAQEVDLFSIQKSFNADNAPAYVRSVDYGRIIIVKMKTPKGFSSVDLEEALKYAVDPSPTISPDLMSKYQNILDKSTFTVYNGVNAEANEKVTDSNIDDLSDAMKKDAVYHPENNPGVPIAYEVAFLKNNELAYLNFSLEYEETDWIEYQNGFIRLVNKTDLTFDFRVTWQEPDHQGKPVEKACFGKIGSSHRLDLPVDATSIQVYIGQVGGVSATKTLMGPTNCSYSIQFDLGKKGWHLEENCPEEDQSLPQSGPGNDPHPARKEL